MAFPTKLSDLCTPSLIFFSLSVLGILLTLFQNMNNSNVYSCGNFMCRVPSTMIVFALKALGVLFWTWVLNLMCKDGHKEIAWILILLPFISMFMGMVMIDYNRV